MSSTETTETTRRRRADGERSRAAILEAAGQLATVEGLDGLSIARLAKHVGMSKSGLFAHFGSKEELQLATIDAADAVFQRYVVQPALDEDGPLDRLRALCERFLSHVERGVFPGGCFFASVAAELDTRPGPVRERIAVLVGGWFGLLEQQVAVAQQQGELDASDEPGQLAFELNAFLLLANAQFLMAAGNPTPLARARGAIERRLRAAGAS